MSVKADIGKLLKSQKPIARVWGDEEMETLLEFKRAGVGYRTIFGSDETMRKYFPGRSLKAIKSKYYDVGRE